MQVYQCCSAQIKQFLNNSIEVHIFASRWRTYNSFKRQSNHTKWKLWLSKRCNWEKRINHQYIEVCMIFTATFQSVNRNQAIILLQFPMLVYRLFIYKQNWRNWSDELLVEYVLFGMYLAITVHEWCVHTVNNEKTLQTKFALIWKM